MTAACWRCNTDSPSKWRPPPTKFKSPFFIVITGSNSINDAGRKCQDVFSTITWRPRVIRWHKTWASPPRICQMSQYYCACRMILIAFFSQVAINDYLAYFSFSLLSCQSEKVEEVLKALCLITSCLTTICLLTFVRTSFSSRASLQVPISCTLTGTHKFTSLLWNFYRRKFM